MKKLLFIILILLAGCSTQNQTTDQRDISKIALNGLYDDYYVYSNDNDIYRIDCFINDEIQYSEKIPINSKVIFGIAKVQGVTYLQIVEIENEMKVTKQIDLSEYGSNIQIEDQQNEDILFTLDVEEGSYKIVLCKQ